MPEALIIDACRTPRGIGKVGKGALADMHPQHVAAAVLKALADRNGLNTAEVDDVIWGTSSQRGPQSNDLARMAAASSGSAPAARSQAAGAARRPRPSAAITAAASASPAMPRAVTAVMSSQGT